MKKVGYLWHSFYSGNLGVSALSDSNIRIVKNALIKSGKDNNVKHILFGPKGDEGFKIPQDIGDVEYVEVSSVFNFFKIRQKLKECDLILDIGSGDSFSDIYGFKRFLKICGLKLICPNAKDKLIISPQTLGPFNSWWAKLLAKFAFSCTYAIFTRDSLSKQRAVELITSNGKEINLTTDVAFSLKRLEEYPDNYPVINTNLINIGINVSGLLYSGGYSGRNQFSLSLDYSKLIDSIISRYQDESNIKIWLIPHVFQIERPSFESDLDVAKLLKDKFKKVDVSPIFHDAREAKTFIAKMDLVLAARMHAAIAAVSSGVACIPMSYSVKFQGLFNSIDYPYTVDLKQETQENVLKEIASAINNRSTIRESAQHSSKAAMEKLEVYLHSVYEFIDRKF